MAASSARLCAFFSSILSFLVFFSTAKNATIFKRRDSSFRVCVTFGGLLRFGFFLSQNLLETLVFSLPTVICLFKTSIGIKVFNIWRCKEECISLSTGANKIQAVPHSSAILELKGLILTSIRNRWNRTRTRIVRWRNAPRQQRTTPDTTPTFRTLSRCQTLSEPLARSRWIRCEELATSS